MKALLQPGRRALATSGLGLAWLLAAAAPLQAVEVPPPLPEGAVNVIGIKMLEEFVLRTKNDAISDKVIEPAESGWPFPQLTRVKVIQTTGKPWNSALDIDAEEGISAGDWLFLRFYYRLSPEAAEASGKFTVQVSEYLEPYNKALDRELEATPQWKRFDLAFQAEADVDASRGELTFLLGSQPQSIDIGGIRLLNYGTTIERTALPADGDTPVMVEAE